MTPQPTVGDDGAVSRGSSIAASAGLGVIAAAIGYLLTYLLIVDEVRDSFGDGVADWQGVAWYFYNAHLVDIETSGSFGSFGGSSTVDFIAQSSSTSSTLLYVIPPLVLLGTGALLARQFEVTDIGEGVVVGAPVTIGYALVAVLGAFATEASAEGSFFGVAVSGSMAPEPLTAFVLAGLLFPMVFATTGAVLVAAFSPP